MATSSAHNYVKTRVMTAGPVELQLMLHDGAISCCRQAREALMEKNYEVSHEQLLKAQDIVLELSSGLRPDVHAELCANLGSLYHFTYRQLFEANISHDEKLLDGVIDVLRTLRGGWKELAEKLALQKQPHRMDIQPGQPMELSA